MFPVFCHGVTRFLHHYPSIISVCLTLTQMHLPQSLPLHRINGFARFFHGFISVLLLHSGHTSKPHFFHCFSIVSRVLYAIMVPHRSLNFTWHHFTLSLFFPPFFLAFLCDQFILPFHQFFQCFAMVLLDFSSVSNACPNAPSTIPTVAPYKRFCSFPPWFFFCASTP